MSDTPSYTLLEPLTRRSKTGDQSHEELLTVLPIKALRARDLRATDMYEGDSAKTIALVAHMTGLTISEADELSIRDLKALGKIVESF